jgi:hypothetical protein
MNLKNLFAVSLVFFLFSLTTEAQTKKQRAAAGYTISNYEVECMGTGMDGTQLIKVWGFGKKPDDAIYMAKKNAVHAVIFKGILGGKPGCMTRPLVNQPDAEQKNREYFNSFFADGGRYLAFVSQTGDGKVDRIKVSNKDYKVGIIVAVMHSQLRSELEAAGILKELSRGF